MRPEGARGLDAANRRAALAGCLWPGSSGRRPISDFSADPAGTTAGVALEDLRLRSPRNPHDPIPAWLARPDDGRRHPAVVCLHGSGRDRDLLLESAYALDDSNRLHGWALELARRGWATLALTQRCCGGRPGRMAEWAKTEQLHGRTAMGGLVEDVLCAVDHLSEHCPWVDPGRIAVTGLSLGGIVAFYAAAVDERIAAVAPVCGGVGSLRTLAEQGHTDYHSTYYYVPGLLGAGDHLQLLEAIAPRAALVVGAEDDVGMPAAAVRELGVAGEQVYAQAGAPSGAWAVRLRPGGHALLPQDLDAVDAWLRGRLRPGGT